jgi:hypothetical protein
MSTMVSEHEKREIDLTAGRVRYRDTLGDGPPIVFVHGYLADGRLWGWVVDALADRFRCIAPDLPFGAHRIPMSPDADLPRRPRRDRRRADRAARARRRHRGRQRLRRRRLPGPRHHPSRADRPAGADQLRHPRELPARDLQGAAAARQAARRHLAAAAAVPDQRGHQDRLRALLERRHTARLHRRLGRGRLRRGRGAARPRQGHRRVEQALHARGGRGAARLAAADPAQLGAPGDRFFPMRYPQRLAAEAANARIVQIEGSKTFVPLDAGPRLAEEISQFAETA